MRFGWFLPCCPRTYKGARPRDERSTDGADALVAARLGTGRLHPGPQWVIGPWTCAERDAATATTMSPVTSSARRAGNNSPPRSNCPSAPRPGQAQCSAHSSSARSASPYAGHCRHCYSVTMASVAAQMILPVWIVGAGAFSSCSWDHRINGGRLIELHRDWAVVELAENGSQRIIDRRRLDVGISGRPGSEPEAAYGRRAT